MIDAVKKLFLKSGSNLKSTLFTSMKALKK